MNRPLRWAVILAFASPFATLVIPAPAWAQSPPLGAPPPEAKALVEGTKDPGEAPKIESKTDYTTITLSSGGQGSTGKSRLMAITEPVNVPPP